MPLPRRAFIGLGSLLACGAVFRPRSLMAAGGAEMPLFAENEAALAFVGKYSRNIRVVGASVLGRIRGVSLPTLHVLAELSSLQDLAAAFRTKPSPGVYAEDNSLNLQIDDVEVTVENLLPADYQVRLAAILTPLGNAFAHDALTYDPQSKALSDPFDARAGAVKIVNKDFLGPAALDVMLRGLLEAKQLGLHESTDFAKWRNQVLGWTATTALAPQYARSFLRPLATLADELPAASIETIVRSPLISAALGKVFEIKTAAAVAQFKKARAKAGTDTSDAALWLVALMEKEIRTNGTSGAVSKWLEGGRHFQVLRSREALAEAGKLVLG